MEHPFRLYGHRGAAAHHPENTLRSFEAALLAGVDAIETDVRLCSDGTVAVFHDADGRRTASRPDVVRKHPWSEVATWDLGEGQRPIRLSDLLEAWPELFVNVDVKDDEVEAGQRTVALVQRMGRERTVGLGSFHGRVARAMVRAGYRGQMALYPAEVAAVRLLPAFVAARLVRGDAAQIPTHQGEFRLDRPAFVARCHAMGLRVDYWTIDDPAEAVALVEAGADGIVTNDPEAIGRALRSSRSGGD